MIYLKKAGPSSETGQANVRSLVDSILAEIRQDGEVAATRFAKQLDKWDGDILLSAEARQAAIASVPEKLRSDICFAHENVKRFAEAQKSTLKECEVEIIPGLVAGQKHIPVSAAGCYVPGGRYSHIASAIMTITTAKVAGVPRITACSPPRPGIGIPPAIIFAMDLCGADSILNLGGVQGIAAMANGLFGLPKSDILVGPGNQYVAEAKRALFGEVGIDMFAGPTDSMIIADSLADPEIVTWDLVGQAEHGYNSPVWLVTTDRFLAERVLELAPKYIETLPEPNRSNANAAWTDHAEVILCRDDVEMADVADDYAPEHLHVQTLNVDWWLQRLRCYGSLFLGEETTVAFGDKAAGPNHVLPTSRAARYTGGLSVHKFMKTVTWQRATRAASRVLAVATARISRVEGMEGHARSADTRLTKYYPGEIFETHSMT
ncbi:MULTISPECIES: histidinol dehydrogenase [unclassified Mesorhizobium]|uniref:histidinol dehydrogenase n=1 Tax=unclassified Mesorhizobium TaxID=325217 RepID=UPI001092409F|nr:MULTISPECIES: histidinol dehydrogenase [unclassified Mesorhizobium]TGQ40546.1 histidinol dehydrogenase [Mesorhizobium sp. M4B.F.Ca.ET.214.01.1.1]TGQ60603.1 histidinol dehydrogenase [Mesorhizobium sp. M4B.F.Ca.ET.211.01.1.1]TGU36471.1 histidinol dehydrogenase [Mesorhizobium sp. M4B.F.Ca.ET.150.01.1.1]TIX17027.1 MAG: histidinol dehydrogenase [Mesorhizobium sp.]